jgi:ABC-2 type transport system ATP-binding protein
VRDGEVLGVIGPNGAGKTTLLECVAGILPSDRGNVMSADKRLDADSRSAVLFYVPDAIAPWPAETVRWALAFTVGFLGGRAADVDGVVKDMDLEPF